MLGGRGQERKDITLLLFRSLFEMGGGILKYIKYLLSSFVSPALPISSQLTLSSTPHINSRHDGQRLLKVMQLA